MFDLALSELIVRRIHKLCTTGNRGQMHPMGALTEAENIFACVYRIVCSPPTIVTL